MAYMNQERKKVIAAAIKPVLAKYGIKGTLAVRNHSTITLNISTGPIDFIGNSNAVCAADDWQVSRGWKPNTDGYVDVNPYHFARWYNGVALDFLTEAFAALQSAGWYDKSDAQVDYFETAYYYGINVGQWNKPYICTASLKQAAA